MRRKNWNSESKTRTRGTHTKKTVRSGILHIRSGPNHRSKTNKNAQKRHKSRHELEAFYGLSLFQRNQSPGHSLWVIAICVWLVAPICWLDSKKSMKNCIRKSLLRNSRAISRIFCAYFWKSELSAFLWSGCSSAFFREKCPKVRIFG